MNIIETAIQGVLIIEPKVIGDKRGFFMEAWNRRTYAQAGLDIDFVQDNISVSGRGVLRGLHFQNPGGQGKLVQVLRGEVFDVAVDIRPESPAFGQWVSCRLSEANHRQFFVPAGLAHGFCVMSETAIFSYKCTEFYNPACEGGILWNDPDLNIDWPLETPVLSEKDGRLPRLKDIPVGHLPSCES
jgi:dTDP-4-dehydrorhamnose 3,5-epimerase